jgi:hypothetical protein
VVVASVPPGELTVVQAWLVAIGFLSFALWAHHINPISGLLWRPLLECLAGCGHDLFGEYPDLPLVVVVGPVHVAVHAVLLGEGDQHLGPLVGGALKRLVGFGADDAVEVVDLADRRGVASSLLGCRVDSRDSLPSRSSPRKPSEGSQPSALVPVRASMRGPYAPSQMPIG